MKKRKLFIAGSTGVVGKSLVSYANRYEVPIIPHLRPKHTSKDERAAIFALDDFSKLCQALEECTTVVQLIGTMRKRFASGDTYETSDIGTTQQLVSAAKESKIDHFILLSSVGAGRPLGAYLKAKAKAEDIVKQGFPKTHTIFRPSAFQGEGRKIPPGAKALTRIFGLKRYEPILVDDLALSILHVACDRAPLHTILEGELLWGVVTGAQSFFQRLTT